MALPFRCPLDFGEAVSTYYVNRVRKERAPNGVHEHVERVCTTQNLHYTRSQVIASIGAGNVWMTTTTGGQSSKIKVVASCGRCTTAPYIRTEADSTTSDNLLSLPIC
jgi:hypothetical protein